VKKAVSISLVFLVLTAMLNLSVATHYCGGKEVAKKVSLSGELASCGMESTDEEKSPGLLLKNHCCEDVTTTYHFSNNYLPSSFEVKEIPGQQISNTHILFSYLVSTEIQHNNHTSDLRPPGIHYPNSVALPVLCVFLI